VNSSVGVAREGSKTAGLVCLPPFLYTCKDGFLVAMDPCPELSLGTLNTVVVLKVIMEQDVSTMGCNTLVFEAVEPFCFPLTLFISPS
jgi:hypothetical protein